MEGPIVYVVQAAFGLGEIVFLRTDPDQHRRVVTGIKICPDESYLYELICGTTSSAHYDFEISREKDHTFVT